MSCSHCQELSQQKQANRLHKSEQPIKSPISKLTQLLILTTTHKFPLQSFIPNSFFPGGAMLPHSPLGGGVPKFELPGGGGKLTTDHKFADLVPKYEMEMQKFDLPKFEAKFEPNLSMQPVTGPSAAIRYGNF